KNERLQASINNNMGLIYEAQGDFRKALAKKTLALETFRKAKDSIQVGDCYNNLGNLYYKKGDLQKALLYYDSSLVIRQKRNSLDGIATSYINIASVYKKSGKRAMARNYFTEANLIARKIGYKEIIHLSYQGMASIDSLDGKWKSALHNFKLSSAYHDSITNLEKLSNTIRQQMQYGFERKQATDKIKSDARAKREKLKHDQEIQQHKLYTWVGTAASFLMLGIALASYRAFTQKKKFSKLIAEQKSIAEEKQREVLDSIHYARRIQQSRMPNARAVARMLQRFDKFQ
ncbi:MAG TPA: tetratricopeptide repeat protein, partial [Flavobacteriales bacterium]|nr:tetratricopeptide repeat protein [Flavobacteriales bacterium]